MDKELIKVLANFIESRKGDNSTTTVRKMFDWLEKAGYQTVKTTTPISVHIASFSDEDGTEIVGVYSSDTKAKEAIQKIKDKNANFYCTPYINEYAVDEEITEDTSIRGGERW